MALPAVLPILGGLAIRAALLYLIRFLVEWLAVFLVTGFMWLKGGVTRTFGVGLLLLKIFGPIAGILYVVVTLLGGMDAVALGFDAIANEVEEVVALTSGIPAGEYLAKVERVLPLTLIFRVLLVLGTIQLVALGVRLVKSLTPGLGS